ncbi:Lrp/AsnC family transcriptional regulator [Actinoplanes couchii]|uniref:AsnC family transcriptional regulator n=1 Tax=Actinoplanes couchii TaxID=403638 RepID=A0ABQ3XMJ4_9ACTN|nr:AsnC family transcriptional regulator [Actinoplanes couchii]MDR6321626.1 DNA-binding Lrp family transcriptional regulator [Actinoplanes couchii]GID59721.1 AsnC family transcriptional regulator [Actinoplanes couchii]
MEFDTLDQQIVHALRVDGRAGYREIGAALGVSDQTIARRYRKLRETAGVRVIGLPNPIRLGYETWMLRLHTGPDMAMTLARALARRSDTSWVSLSSGGTEVACNVRVPAHADRESLLLEKLPRTPRLVSVSAHCLIHHFVGGVVGPDRHDDSLTRAQIELLTPAGPPPPYSHVGPVPATSAAGPPVRLSGEDDALLEALARDGRTGYAELSTATGWPESTVRRRMRELRGSGALYYDVELKSFMFGFLAPVQLWLTVAPAHLAAVGQALTEHEEVVFAAATTGATNLVAIVVCRDMPAFYRYLTERVSGLDGVDRVESAPLLRHVKQLGSVTGML